jgi:uncharacterized paraquat-inducible protein A
MYTQFLTSAWQMDRCLEAAWIAGFFMNPYIIFVILTVLFLFGFTTFDTAIKNKIKSLKKFKTASVTFFYLTKLALSSLVAVILALPTMFMLYVASILVGLLLFNCSMDPLWASIQPAHEVHATLKQIRENGGQTPRSLEELQTINPAAYEKMEANAKIEYEYIPERDGYHFTVRPSKYFLADFSDEHDYVLYQSKSVFSEPKPE